MAALPDLFPGFAERRIATTDAQIFLRTGGSGPPLLLLHGYPQTHVCWHAVAPDLARRFTLVMPDLRGYGQSAGPAADAGHHAYSKRTMARDCVELMRTLGHEQFQLAGHDRGGRVAYRMALDHPAAVLRLATLDIVPTYDAWLGWGPADAVGKFHWPFLARPAPFPEQMIGRDPVGWLEYLLASWSGTGDLSPFSAGALQHYRAHFSRADMIAATCADYRAGASTDFEADAAERKAGRKIACPVLALWGPGRSGGFLAQPLETWRAWCDDVRGEPIPCGHFLAEEDPHATLAALIPFLTGE